MLQWGVACRQQGFAGNDVLPEFGFKGTAIDPAMLRRSPLNRSLPVNKPAGMSVGLPTSMFSGDAEQRKNLVAHFYVRVFDSLMECLHRSDPLAVEDEGRMRKVAEGTSAPVCRFGINIDGRVHRLLKTFPFRQPLLSKVLTHSVVP